MKNVFMMPKPRGFVDAQKKFGRIPFTAIGDGYPTIPRYTRFAQGKSPARGCCAAALPGRPQPHFPGWQSSTRSSAMGPDQTSFR